MKIARVLGKLTLNVKLAEVRPASYLLVQPLGRSALAGGAQKVEDFLVMYDDLGAGAGDLVGLVEGREAAMPWHPAKAPYDAYCACILETLNFQPVLPVEAKTQ